MLSKLHETMDIEDELSYESVQAAYARIKPYIHETPVLTSAMMNGFSARKELFFKAECFQKTGSFKARGAMNAVLIASKSGIYTGISTHSSGNYAQALAWASGTVKSLPAHIVMPNNCPSIKQAAVLGYGATVYICEPTLQAREQMSEEVSRATGNSYLASYTSVQSPLILLPIRCISSGSLFIHPSENLNVISGQGTIAIELLSQVPDLEAIVVPIGGGGLISGIATAAKRIKEDILIIGAEPLNADDAFRSKESKQLIKHATTPVTIADGLRTSLGNNTWPVVRDLVDDIMTVSESEIMSALYLVWQRMKVMIEPSAAVSVAVAISEAFGNRYQNIKRVGVILCGGTLDC